MTVAAMLPDAFSRYTRPTLVGALGAVATAHPLASMAGQLQLAAGGSAADAVIAAQAVLAVVAPEAGGLGGDAFAIVREGTAEPVAINAAGRSALRLPADVGGEGTTVNVPGMVAGWAELLGRWGRRRWGEVLAPAIRLAENGFPVRPQLQKAVSQQRERLLRGGAGEWVVLRAEAETRCAPQRQLAQTLITLSEQGADWFYNGEIATAICRAVGRHSGHLSVEDFASHRTAVLPPICVSWADCKVHLQPPMSQGILLAMALKGMAAYPQLRPQDYEHAAIELTELAFASRDRVGQGRDLLQSSMDIDLQRAGRRGGPRAYLHTAGVAAADHTGLVVSSLLSVFDDFGSAIFVPEGGFVMNNRGASFTSSPNDMAAAKLPVHTLAPILFERGGTCVGLSTPGADGQVQTLLQVLMRMVLENTELDVAIDAPRWRSENKQLLIEASHQARNDLTARGHDIVLLPDGDAKFGSVVCAGLVDAVPVAVADWRRESWAGVA